ncbi:uncharacterized protein LOC123548576 isoform X1 [Mercenaria mercenaria]|uniref:uncharacterized protein LOC123548576 isoform X1 n=1 Tax=Mercenaria mercenaria TaxID=6596 RepID=UPI00234EA670|nr:uncharacterized protein LOC123548576 isoform X1 [Mercenaria mercenaria]
MNEVMEWGVDNIYRAITLVSDWVNRNENVQVNSIVVFVDNTHITMNHVLTLFGHDNGNKTMHFWQMFLHGNSLAKVYDEIGMSVLPDEYLPDDYDGPRVGTHEKIANEMLEDMMSPEFREYIRDLSSEKYGVDLKERKQDHTPEESFRKLNVE